MGLRHTMRARTGAAAIWAGFAASALLATSAAAYDGETGWVKFPGSQYQSNDPTDRSFIKEWEASPPKGFPTLSAENLAAMKVAINRYKEIAAGGGWQPLPDVKLQAGMSHPAVTILRERLWLSGDLQERGGSSQSFDYYLDKAVKRYQASNGLAPTGIVDKATTMALNVPAAARLKQLQLNLTRLTELVRTAAKKYVVVNIPAAQIEAVENGQVVSRHAGVVGKIDRQTPILKSAVHELNFNAVWSLPPTVIEKDLIPKGQEMARRGQSVLVKYHIDAYGGDGRKLDPNKVNWSTAAAKGLTYRQQPGPENPLGFVKINFHNSYSVYMHDTPSQSLFGRNFRAASSGCVRVHGVEQLASWLVAEQGWRPEHVLQMKQSGERRDVKLRKPVPLYFVYVTAWATPDGVVQFRRDLYKKDGVGAMASDY
ncbi:MAG: L,D-transpeptidase family protein [Hyphomicrobiaceae bacterium]|nr:MAG: L,D-transpeptidase family protein [Hyphomicrobiaceae bacterium]